MFNTRARSFRTILFAACIAAVLAACGGGGGESGTKPTTVLEVAPATMTASVQVNNIMPNPMHATGTVGHQPDFANRGEPFSYIVDPSGVIDARTIGISKRSTTKFDITMMPSPRLAVGVHKGALKISICHDKDCNSHYPGSPMNLPYEITVTAPPNPG